ncbi:hypothetical protein A2U01_0096679, partial [Trifolium medium]|nr:hypothetical protein [Trifolium medium]
ASRSLVWRGAPVKQVVEGNLLEVARRAVGYDAARRFKKFKFLCTTDNCASHSADGAAREHGKLCRFLH